MGFVYIIRGNLAGKRTYYVGSTVRRIEERICEHYRNESKYTSKLTNKICVFFMEISSKNVRSVEFYLKKHRKSVYHLAGGKKSKVSIIHFKNWLNKHGIKVRNMGNVSEYGKAEYVGISKEFRY